MIAIGCDHGGYRMKEKIKDYFTNIEFKDFGTFSEERVDFIDYAIPVAESVVNGECEKGILICRNGLGMSMAANKVKGIRCALCYSMSAASFAKEHHDANVIAIGADECDFEEIKNIIETWLNAKFLGGRYQERIDRLNKFETERMR